MKLKKLVAAITLAVSSLSAQAAITDGAFSVNQIFDVQYYWSGNDLNASNFIAPYDSGFNTVTVTSGQYFKFIDNNDGSYGLGLYNSNNTLDRVIHQTGTITALGSGAIFYIGSGFFGNVISTSQGYSYGDNATFTNMDQSVTSSDLASYTWASTTPLADGQTAGSTPAPSGPVYVAVTQPTVVSVTPTSTNSPPGETAEYAIDGDPTTKYLNFDRANAGFTIKLQSAQVLQGIKFTTANDFPDRDPTKYSLYGSNDGVNWTTIVNAESITLSDNRYTQTSMYTITNTNPYFYYFVTFPDIKASSNYADLAACGLACDSVQIGDVEFIYDSTFVFTAPTDTGTGTIANPGTAGSVSDVPTPVVGPQPVVNASGSTSTNPTGTTVTTVNNAGTYTNDGTTGDVTNTGTFTNNGTTSNVNNAGTFNNNGIIGDLTNTGTFYNNQGGVVNSIVYNNYWIENNGTVNSVTYNGGTIVNNSTGVIGLINNTEAHGTFQNDGTVTGSVTTNSTFNNNATGIVQGVYTNSGTLNNTGTVGDVTNTGTFTNSGNTGTVTNTGTFNYNGGTLGGYNQTTGTTVISINQPILVTGVANVGGGLTMTNVPNGYGKYTILSAGSVNGTYDTLSGNSNYLKYSLTDIKLYVAPDTAATQSSIDTTTKNLSNAINLQSSAVTGALGNDCAVFGSMGACVSVNGGMSKAANGDLYNGGLTIAKKVNDNWRLGVTTNTPFNNPTIGNVSQTSDSAFGVFATWTKERLSIQGSAAFNQGTMTMTRQGPETGIGKMSVDNKAYQLRASYAVPVNETITVTPYIGVRHVESNYGGYTETGPVFPLTVNGTTRNQTSAIAGVSLAKQLTEKLSGNVSLGITRNLTGQSVTFTGTSEISGLSTFNSSLPTNSNINPSVGAGLSYSIDKTTRVGVNVGVQQKGDNANISSIGISITRGF
jgi:hypothetical protein